MIGLRKLAKVAKLAGRIARLNALCAAGRSVVLTYCPPECVPVTLYRGPNRSPVDVCVEDNASGYAWIYRRGTWREMRLYPGELSRAVAVIDDCNP